MKNTEVSFNIVTDASMAFTVTLSQDSFGYNGNSQVPTVIVKVGETEESIIDYDANRVFFFSKAKNSNDTAYADMHCNFFCIHLPNGVFWRLEINRVW